MLWHSLLAAATASASVLPIRDAPEPVSSFALDVARRETGKRDFMREWTAARQKWGGNVPSKGASAFSLADSGK